MQALQQAAGQKAFAKSAFEQIKVAGLSEALDVIVVGFNLGQFLEQGRVTDVEASEPRERFGGRIVTRAFDQVSRGFGKDEHSNDKNNGPGELDSDGDTVRTGVVTVMRGIVDNGG